MMARSLVLLLALSLSTPIIGVNVTIGVLTSDQSDLVPLQMAVNDVNENLTVLPNVHLQLDVSQLPDFCDDQCQFIRIMNKISDSRVVTTFTPELSCEIGPLVASLYSKKITISHECSGHHLSDKLQYPLLVRTYPSESIAAHSILSFLSHTKWDRITVVKQRKWISLSNLVLSWARRYKVKISYTCFVDVAGLTKEFSTRRLAHETILRTLYKTKVYVFLGEVTLLRDFVFILSEITDHQRVAVVSFDKDAFIPNSFYVPKPERVPQELVRASQIPDGRMEPKSLVPERNPSLGLFVVSRAMPDHEAFSNISNRLRNLTKTEDEDRDASQLVRAEYVYDAVSIYARALDWILRSQHIESEDQIARLAANGTALFTAITSIQNFTSVTGDIISFDRNGDRLVRYIVAASRNWIEETHSTIVSAEPMVIVGSFQTDANLTTFKPSAKIKWSPEEIQIPFATDQRFPEVGINFFAVMSSLVVFVTASFAPAILKKLIIFLDRNIDYELKLPVTMVAVNDPSQIKNLRNDWRIKVYIRTFHMFPKRILNARERKELIRLRHMRHPNINRLWLTPVRLDRIVLVSEFCANRSLWDLLLERNRRLTNKRVVSSLMLDLIRGMIYLHQQIQVPDTKRVHGNLKSTNCLIDSYWNLKLTDFGLQQWRPNVKDDEDTHYLRRLWWAPELLRDEEMGRLGTRKGDIYAFGVIIHEILGKQGPFGIWSFQTTLRDPKDVIERVKRGPTGRLARYRPPWHCITEHWNGRMDPHLCWCMKECWREDPSRRPKSFVRILECLQDHMTQGIDFVMEIATDRSPGINAFLDKERQIMRQREQKLEKLLSLIRPQRSPVVPRPLGHVSVLVVDIVRFTDITSRLTPLQTLLMLDDVYSLFDQICQNYGGNFKIGTVGDAYIASGIDYPVYRSVFEVDGDSAASGQWNQTVQIAKMAREFLVRIQTLNIPEIGHPLSARIGISKGPAVLGLSGLYWIFGHCLSEACNMQSTGRSSCIQLSRPFYEELVKSGLYQGELHSVKVDHTDQEYYWLLPATDQLDCGSFLDPHPSKLCYRGSFISSNTE